MRAVREHLAHLQHLVVTSKVAPLFSGFTTFLWGVWLVLPFDVFSTAEAYDTLAAIASEEAWGFVFIGTGLSLIHGTWNDYPNVVRYGAFISSYLYLFITLGFIAVNWRLTPVPVHGSLMLLNVAIHYQHHKERYPGRYTSKGK